MIEGIILKGYSGHYYVSDQDTIWECSLRGRFKVEKQTVLPGDRVRVKTLNNGKGVIDEVMPRSSELLRPPIANVEQVILVFAIHQPEPNWALLDRMLILAEEAGINPLICFNKDDLMTSEDEINIGHYKEIYPVAITSAKTGDGIGIIEDFLRDKISVFAGPSGVGKSSLLNAVQPGLSLKTGAVSEKIHRGRHTTRHVELMPLSFGGLVADTPGFSSLDLVSMEPKDLVNYFPEFEDYEGNCKFTGCFHDKEPKCAVKEAVEKGEISSRRYENYQAFLAELKAAKERRY